MSHVQIWQRRSATHHANRLLFADWPVLVSVGLDKKKWNTFTRHQPPPILLFFCLLFPPVIFLVLFFVLGRFFCFFFARDGLGTAYLSLLKQVSILYNWFSWFFMQKVALEAYWSRAMFLPFLREKWACIVSTRNTFSAIMFSALCLITGLLTYSIRVLYCKPYVFFVTFFILFF